MKSDFFQKIKEQFQDDEYEEIRPHLESMIVKNIHRADALYMLGTIHYKSGKFNKAIKCFERALEDRPQFEEAGVALSVLLNDIGRYEEGQAIFEKVNQSNYRKILADKYTEIARIYFKNRQSRQAIKYFSTALSYNSDLIQTICVPMAEAHTQLHQVHKAIELLQKVCQNYPRLTEAWLGLGKIYYNSQQIARAISAWQRVLQIDPQNKRARSFLKQTKPLSTEEWNRVPTT